MKNIEQKSESCDLSVVIPHYNDHKSLRNTLAELAGQKDIDLEVIVVDDFSGQECDGLVQDVRSNGLNVGLHTMAKRAGTLACRLKGLELASGPYVAFMDSDDLLNGEYAYAHALKPHRAERPDIIHYNSLVKNRWGYDTVDECMAPVSDHPLKGRKIFETWLESGCKAHTVWNKFYSRALCKRLHTLDHSLQINQIEDFYLSACFFLLAESYLSIPDIVYKYHPPVTKSLEKSAASALDCLRMYLELPDTFKKYTLDEESRIQFKKVLRMMVTVNAAQLCEFLTDNSENVFDVNKLEKILSYGTESEIFLALAVANGSTANKIKDIAYILRYAW